MNKNLQAIIFIISFLMFCACNEHNKESRQKADIQVFENSDEQIKAITTITLKPNAYESVSPLFEKIIAGSQAEEGCIYYDLHKELGDTTNTKFIMLEVWLDQAALDAHNEQLHYKTFLQTSVDYVEDIKTTAFKVAK